MAMGPIRTASTWASHPWRCPAATIPPPPSPSASRPPPSCPDRIPPPGKAGDDALRPCCKIAEAAQGGAPHHVAQEENSGIEVEHNRIEDGEDQEPHHEKDGGSVDDSAQDLAAERRQARSDQEGADPPQ